MIMIMKKLKLINGDFKITEPNLINTLKVEILFKVY